MSKKDPTPSQAEPSASHHDELIVVPKGRSKMQFLFIMGLMIFVLLIFTVGGNFQQTMGGMFGGGGSNPVELSWRDPLTGERQEVRAADFVRTGDMLERLTKGFPLFLPWHADPGRGPEAEDVALFMILEDLAVGAGIDISAEEHKELLKATFVRGDVLRQQAAFRSLKPQQLEESMRRVWRVQKLIQLVQLGIGDVRFGSSVQAPQDGRRGYGAVDAERMRSIWGELHREYRFDYVEIASADYLDEARAALPDAAALEEWFTALSPMIQREHFTEIAYSVQVAWAPIDDEGFDETALLERYPAPEEGRDRLESTYFSLARAARFEKPEEEQGGGDEDGGGDDGGDEDAAGGGADDEAAAEDTSDDLGDDTTGDASGDGDGTGEQDPGTDEDATQEGDAQTGENPDENAEGDDETSTDTEDDEVTPAVPQHYDQDEVQEQVAREALIHQALAQFLGDMQEASAAARTTEDDGEEGGDQDPGGEETPDPPAFDFRASAEALGLSFAEAESMTEQELEDAEWGGTWLRQRFTFRPPAESFIASVVIEDTHMAVVWVEAVLEPHLPEFSLIQDAVAEDWVEENAALLAEAKLDEVRNAFGQRPEDDPATEDVDESKTWTAPDVSSEAFHAAAEALGFEVVERPWLEKFAVPNDDYDAASDADQFFRSQTFWNDLEEGDVPPPRMNRPKTLVYLAHFLESRPKPASAMDSTELVRMRGRALQEAQRSFDEQVLRLDSDWFMSTFVVKLGAWDRKTDDPYGFEDEQPEGDGAE